MTIEGVCLCGQVKVKVNEDHNEQVQAFKKTVLEREVTHFIS